MSAAPARVGDRVVVFDLDDTLYLERDFALSGYDAAGRHCAGLGLPGMAEACADLFAAGHRTEIFDKALAALGRDPDPALVARLVEIYRTHPPDIALAPDARRYFARPRPWPHALISDGGGATQRGKVVALGLDRLIDLVICTGEWGRDYWKPHPRAYKAVEDWSGAAGPALVYVADNPSKDFVTPRARGWWTVQIARRERVHHVAPPDEAHAAHAAIESLDDLEATLLALDPAWGSPFASAAGTTATGGSTDRPTSARGLTGKRH